MWLCECLNDRVFLARHNEDYLRGRKVHVIVASLMGRQKVHYNQVIGPD